MRLAVSMAQVSNELGVQSHWGAMEVPDGADLPRTRGRRHDRVTDSRLRDFLALYADTEGTVSERAAQLGYSRQSVYRLIGEARKRGILAEGETP